MDNFHASFEGTLSKYPRISNTYKEKSNPIETETSGELENLSNTCIK
jgi:hypothetical protein